MVKKKTKRPTGFIYNAEVLRVVDGDTFELKIDLGFKIVHENTFRLYGVNTPETRGKERPQGLKVKEYVKNLIEMIRKDCFKATPRNHLEDELRW